MQGNFAGLRLGDIGDAYLFVGALPELTLSRPNLQRYRDHPELLAELDRRQLIRTGTRFDTSAFFAITPSPFAAGWRADKNTRVPARRDARSEAIRAMARTLAAIGGEGDWPDCVRWRATGSDRCPTRDRGIARNRRAMCRRRY
jgi:hypothetical protein